MVRTVKQTLTKAQESEADPHLAMLCLRTTPIDQDKQKSLYDKNTKPLQPLHQGHHAWVRDPHSKEWTPGKIIAKEETPQSFRVQTQAGTYRRNRHHLRKATGVFSERVLEPAHDDNAEGDEPRTPTSESPTSVKH